MTKNERDKICKTCKHHIVDERYGILCGLTNNLPNFQDKCRYFTKNTNAPVFKSTTRTIYKKRERKGFKTVLGAGITLFLLFKLLMLLIKFFSKQ